MQQFPFSTEDWAGVKDVSIALVNASLADDRILAEALFTELKSVLGELRAKYGEHPVLLETEADFCDEDPESLKLYNQALVLAEGNRLPKSSIQASLHDCLIRMDRIQEAGRVLEQMKIDVNIFSDPTAIAELQDAILIAEERLTEHRAGITTE